MRNILRFYINMTLCCPEMLLQSNGMITTNDAGKMWGAKKKKNSQGHPVLRYYPT